MSGSGGGGGYEYQAKATAYVAAHILAGSGLKWIEHENPDVPVAVAEETGGAGDDLHIVLDDSTEIEIQAKHGLKKNDKFWQAILKLGQGLKDNEKLYGVLLTDSTASKVLREDLRCDLKRIGQGRTDGLKLITKELQHKFAAADLPTESPDLFRRLRIVVVDLDDDLPDGKQAYLLLKEFLDDASQASITWSTLCQEGQYLLSNRGRRDSTEWARLLSSKGIQMKSIYAQVNHMRMPQEKQYLDNLISQFEYGWWQESFKFLYEIDAIDEDSWKPFELKGLIHHKGKKPNPDEKPEPLLKLIKTSQHQRILIVGRSGMGKSTLMRRLLGIKAQEALDDEEIPIPVLVSLSTSEKVIDLIRSSLTNAGLFLTTEQIQKKLADRKLLLLLDGLNEVPDSNMLTDLKNNFSNAPMILTTRETYRDLGIEAQLMIEPLKSSDIEGFLYQNLGEDSSQIQKLCDQMKDFSTPLMAWMLYCIFEMMQEIVPATRGEAYQLSTTIYEEKAKQEFSLEVLREGMRKLAVEMTNCKNCLLESEAKRLVTIEVFARLQASHLLQCKSSGREKKIEFCHPSIQEYYAAEYLISDRQRLTGWLTLETNQQYSIFQQDYLNYLKWTEPVALLLGFPEVSQNLALKLTESALDVDLMLGARLAGEVRSEFHKEIVDFIHDEITLKNLPEWVQVEIWGRVGSDYAINELLKFLNRDDIELVTRAAGFIGDTSNQNAIWTISNRLEKIDKIFSDQTKFGGIDNTHVVWMKHIQALKNVNPRKFVSFLKEKLNTEKRNTIILMCNESIRWLVQLDKNTVKEMIHLLKDSKDENFKHNYILNILEVARFDQNDIFEMLKIFEANSFEPIKIRIINIICNTDFDFLGDELVKIISCLSDEVSYKLRDEISKNIISRGMDKLDVNSLEELLFSCDFEVRYFAAIILGSTDNLLAIPVLISSMCFDDLWIRRKTIQIFHYIKEEKIIIPLLRHYLKDLDPVICREAAFSLSYFGRDDGINEIMSALGQGPLETYYKSIRSLGRLNHREPLWKLIHQKRSEAEYAQFGHWQPVAIELLKLGEMDVFPEICETLLNLNCQSSTEVMNLVAKYADISTVDWLIKVLEEPQRYRTDPYALNRIALTLRRIPVEIIQQRIMQLIVLSQKTHIHQLSWLLPEIQSRSNFYNYEIQQQAEKPRKADRASLGGGGGKTIINQFPNATEVKIFENVQTYHESPPRDPPN